jgi:hypothetical protein
MRVSRMRVVLVRGGIAVLIACAGCASEYHPEYHPVSSYTVNQNENVSYPTIYQVGAQSGASVLAQPVASERTEPKPPSVDPSHVLVVESAHLDRHGEVVAVLDAEDTLGTHASGVALLRERAAALGADAVVSVEFHHGDAGRPSHVSGLAVRFSRASHE